MINYDEIVNEIIRQVTRLEQQYCTRIAARVLGADLDSWGDVKHINSDILTELKKNEKISEAIVTFWERIGVEITKPIPATQIASIAKRVRERILVSIEETIYTELYSELEEIIKPAIREKVVSHSKIIPYLVAERIQK